VRAFVLESFDEQPALRDDVPDPSTGDNELLVHVRASSVNPVDVFIAAGGMQQYAEYEFPVTIGRDFAGEVEQVGSGDNRYHVGDEVFGFVLHANPTVRNGSWAELIAVPEDFQVAAKPPSVSFAESGAAGLAGIAALDAIDALALAEGETVLVIGATGGVGSFFVQLAAAAGAHVIAPAFPEDHDYLRALGVSELVDRDTDFAAAREAHPEGVDAVLDLVSQAPETTLLKEGGRLASTIGAAGEGVGRFNIVAQPAPADLRRLGDLLDAGGLRVHIQRDYTFDQAGEALQALPATHTRGKLSLTIA
jgi:NADPH2:quinone reductase